MEELLLKHFSDRYRRIWVQYSRTSTCLTLFPLNRAETYKIISIKRIIKDVDGLIQLINDKAY